MPNGLIVIAHYHPAHIPVEQFPVFQQAGDYLPSMNETTSKSEETYLPTPPHHVFKFAAILNCTASKQKIMMSLKQSCTSQLSKHLRITRKTATVPTFTL